jgi:Xaa-Pro aminopeptidase
MTPIGHRLPDVAAALEPVDALVVSDLTNVRWLTGFTGSNGVLLVSPGRCVLVTDGRYGDQATAQMAVAGVDADVLVAPTSGGLDALLATACAGLGAAAEIGIEADHLTVAQHTRWTAALGRALRPTSGVVESARRRKSADEVSAIERACAIADRALAEVAPRLGDGLTEAQVRNQLEIRIRELGATGPSYETIVAAGPQNAALPHHRPTATPISPGDTVIIDVGALVEGYHSDMTRTFVVGEPSAQQRELYELVLAAQLAGLAAVGPGVPTMAVDAACRNHITAAGYGEWFTHGTGHGVGLLIHEEPYLNRVSSAVLRPGDVVTVEPGVYRGGFGGIRIEDLVLVTDDGCRLLTASPKDSPCLPSPPTT